MVKVILVQVEMKKDRSDLICLNPLPDDKF